MDNDPMQFQSNVVQSPPTSSLLDNTTFLVCLVLAALLVVFNQWQFSQLAVFSPHASATGAAVWGGENTILAPVHLNLLQGEQAVLSGYKTKIASLPTISPQSAPAITGDAVQDTINALVPTGTPFYGQDAGVSFDDPLGSQQKWGTYERSIQLSGKEDERWNKIVSIFTCDYCCGSPQDPTTINHCGCAHARAWRGMAKYFLKNYGDTYSDMQIIGEMSKWKVLWYPGPTVKRVLEEQAGQSA